MPLGNGDVFAGYTIQGLLGSGPTGEVYLARHPRLSRLDALKILPASLTDDADFRGRFDREADLAATLRHPNIVGLYDRGESDGRLWISMEYVQGTDAARLLREHHPYGLSAPQALEIVTVVAAGLDHAHQHGLRHGDVQPANILLTTTESGQRRILLAGLGIARPTIGTSGAYPAPEGLTGFDRRADQYALAAAAFHLLTGAAPFADGVQPQLAQRRPELASLDPVLSKALSSDPSQRFPRCLDFAHALGQSLGTPTLHAPWPATAAGAPPILTAGPWPAMPSAPAYPGSPPKRTVVTTVLVPLILSVMLLGAGAFAGTQLLRPQSQPSTAAPSWQPYVDYAKQFSVWLTSLSPQSADSDIQRILDGSTGEFHDAFTRSRDDFTETVVGSNVVTQGSVNSAALDSLSDTKAQVLVSATSKVSNNNGAAQEPRSWRLVLRVEKVADDYKVSKVEFVS